MAQQRVRGTGELTLVEPKTTKSRRTVHLQDDVLAALRGEALNPLKMGAALSALLRKADLPRIRVHDLRHTAATLQLAWGTHPKVVQEMLGHSTIAITLDLYSHTMPTMHRDAAMKVGRLFRPPDAVAEASS